MSRSTGQSAKPSADASARITYRESDKAIFQDNVPKILVAGLRKSGKTSILKVLFGRLPAHETCYLESTVSMQTVPLLRNPLLGVKLVELPSHYASALCEDYSEEDAKVMLSQTQSIIVVIDSSDEPYTSALSLAKKLAVTASRMQHTIHIELLIHKTDANYRFDYDNAGNETRKTVYVRDLVRQLSDDIDAMGKAPASTMSIHAHCTSIYDGSLVDAFSKILRRPIAAAGLVENLLDTLVANTRLQKAFLFDMLSKVSIIADTSSSTVDDPLTTSTMQDMLETLVDFSSVYMSGDPKLAADKTTANSSSSNALLACANDVTTACSISLSGGSVLVCKVMDKYLALCIQVKQENLDKRFLVNHNIDVFRRGLADVCRAVAASN